MNKILFILFIFTNLSFCQQSDKGFLKSIIKKETKKCTKITKGKSLKLIVPKRKRRNKNLV